LVDKGVTDNRTAYSLRATTWISRVFFADNDQQPSNIIVREDIFVVLFDWEMAGFVGDLPAEARIADYEYRPGNCMRIHLKKSWITILERLSIIKKAIY
jgi:hypothetical protein